MTMNPDWLDQDSQQPQQPQQPQNSWFMSTQDVDDVLYGIGSGMADSESGFVRGFGRAMAGVVGRRIERKKETKARKERLEDLDLIEQREIRAEERQAARRDTEELRSMDRALDFKRREREAERESLYGQDVLSIDSGLRSPSKKRKDAAAYKAWSNNFAAMMSGNLARFGGSSPIDVYEESSSDSP